MDETGYLDFKYVHKDYQRKGIAKRMLQQIVRKAKEQQIHRIWSSVSITAQPFFEHHGFHTFTEEHKDVKGIHFINALMEKML